MAAAAEAEEDEEEEEHGMDNDKENDSDSANELVAADTCAAVKKLHAHDAKPAVARSNHRV